ncbi:alpha/beta hydrolase [Hyphomonas sp. WL0036]|uniref:alpha/beta fold hydrolase n=1 Tax=Hyphomonas sediminis TaxID=2866160 RepID=UPI001C827D05|nr:alpha/beta hydrolase [Hyphomonas sediminis]MBY9065530.1 alpha/beta hydrolase [Hyphomonas sediminis]
MARIRANGIEIEYEEIGAKNDPLMLLVMGFSGQMTGWPDSFKRGLADAGRRVVVFDNRDIGLSTEFTGKTAPSPRDIVKGITAGEPMHEKVPYVLNDMAADAAALIGELGADKADILGVSMGGMIVQLMALNHPGRVRSLIPVMTTSGDPSVPMSTPEAGAALTAVPENRTPEAIAELAVQGRAVYGSHPDVRGSDDDIRAASMAATRRSDRPEGVARQYAAILAQPRWHDRLATVAHPTLVLHGAADTLILPAAGADIARRIPGAEFELIEKWGHDLPEAMMPALLNRIVPFLGRNVATA